MIRRPPVSTRTYTLFPYPTLCRSMLELVKAALDTMVIRDDRMLERLPPRYLNEPAQRARLAELARDLVASIDDRSIGDAVGAIEDSLLRRGRCPPAGRLVDDVTGSGAITQASRLGRNQPLDRKSTRLNSSH